MVAVDGTVLIKFVGVQHFNGFNEEDEEEDVVGIGCCGCVPLVLES